MPSSGGWGKSTCSLGDLLGGFRIGTQDTAGGQKEAGASHSLQRLRRGTLGKASKNEAEKQNRCGAGCPVCPVPAIPVLLCRARPSHRDPPPAPTGGKASAPSLSGPPVGLQQARLPHSLHHKGGGSTAVSFLVTRPPSRQGSRAPPALPRCPRGGTPLGSQSTG